MQSSPSIPGYALPTIVDPPDTVCYRVELPNDPGYIKAFIGALYATTIWTSWQRDVAHTGIQASQKMKLVWQKTIDNPNTCDDCLPSGGGGVDDGSDFMIRQNPDNPCILESSVNGTDWCQWADLSLCANFGTQPGVGNKPPAPGGGSQQTCKALAATGTLLLPTLVNAGDQIRLESVNGAGWDGFEFDFGPLWRFANGDQYVGGVDVGFPTTDPSDPLPSTNHMKIIAGYGGTPDYLDLPLSTWVTIPGGVSNAQIWLQVNDANLSDNQGSYDLCVTVKNNASGAFTHNFDFTASGQAWSLTPLSWGTNGEYLSTQGWHGTCNGSTDKYNQIVIQRINPSPTVEFTDVALSFAQTNGMNVGTLTSLFFAHHTDGSNETLISKASSSTVSPATWHGSTTTVDYFWLIWSCAVDPGGSCPTDGDVLIPQIVVQGIGTDPF